MTPKDISWQGKKARAKLRMMKVVRMRLAA